MKNNDDEEFLLGIKTQKYEKEDVEAFLKDLGEVCRKHGVIFVGGPRSVSQKDFEINIMILKGGLEDSQAKFQISKYLTNLEMVVPDSSNEDYIHEKG